MLNAGIFGTDSVMSAPQTSEKHASEKHAGCRAVRSKMEATEAGEGGKGAILSTPTELKAGRDSEGACV